MSFAPTFRFGTKAETLSALDRQLEKSTIPPFVYFPAVDWLEPSQRVRLLDEITGRLGGSDVIVRSSAGHEDGQASSLAGAFDSIGPVDCADPAALEVAIDKVIAGYTRTGHSSSGDQVLVQRMVTGVPVSGVAFTQDMNTGAPYYVINYDDQSGDTHTVTGGTGYSNRTLYVFREAWSRLRSVRFRTLIEGLREIESVVGDSNLDVEFAIDANLQMHLFQVRRITTQLNWNRGQSLRIDDALTRIDEHLAQHANGAGTPVLGSMPDWNPAEMIGTTPRPLAFSIYRSLITDRVWADARAEMGYSHVRGARLMTALAGQPFIDVEQSFQSFLPESLSAVVGQKLVGHWLRRLRTNPHLHDKVEFDVAITAFTPDFDQRMLALCEGVLTSEEESHYRQTLADLTNDLLAGRRASMESQLAKLDELTGRRRRASTNYAEPTPRTATTLLDDAIEWGTKPFAILARHGFVATAILEGLVQCGAISVAELDSFRRSIPTVAGSFIADVHRLATGQTDERSVIERYGHLRPGTYDILADRYDAQLAKGLSPFASAPDALVADAGAPLDGEGRERADRALAAAGFEAGIDAVLDYSRTAIQARELAKFTFSHSVSDLLEVVATVGQQHGLSREELSYIDIRHFLDVFVEPDGRSTESQLRALSERGRERHRSTTAVRLPSLIVDPSDVWIVPLRVESPNYVTRNNAIGEVVHVVGTLDDPAMIDGKIVAIASADPGFDWIFTRPIAGLVTQFGGVNSHMAIRCAEFGLPAAIGCGEQIFTRVLAAGSVSLKCAEGQLLVIE